MKTMTAPIRHERELPGTRGRQLIPYVTVSIREVLALLSAVTSVVAIVLLSVWISGVGSMAVASAGTWGIAFVFMALAVDKRESKAFFELTTGLALMVLAWLQNTVSPEFIILTAVLLASWVSIGLYRLLR